MNGQLSFITLLCAPIIGGAIGHMAGLIHGLGFKRAFMTTGFGISMAAGMVAALVWAAAR
jgi:hypothetical protein